MMKKTFFASDFHLGTDGRLSSKARERLIVRWLEHIAPEAESLYLVGDVFDYWFEYSRVVPKGFVRLLGQLARLSDGGLPIYFFTGNHDMWMFHYLEEELGIPVYRQPIQRQIGGKNFFIGHGDGLGPGDQGYKFIKALFSNPVCQWLFARLHPNTGIRLMSFFSGTSRQNNPSEPRFLGPDKERLLQFCEEEITRSNVDYFVFGHRHLPIDYTLKNGRSRYVNLGDWLSFNSYAVFDGHDLKLQFFENDKAHFFGH